MEAAQKRQDAAQAKKRIAIAAEALTNASNVKIPNIPKNDAVLKLFGAPLHLEFCTRHILCVCPNNRGDISEAVPQTVSHSATNRSTGASVD